MPNNILPKTLLKEIDNITNSLLNYRNTEWETYNGIGELNDAQLIYDLTIHKSGSIQTAPKVRNVSTLMVYNPKKLEEVAQLKTSYLKKYLKNILCLSKYEIIQLTSRYYKKVISEKNKNTKAVRGKLTNILIEQIDNWKLPVEWECTFLIKSLYSNRKIVLPSCGATLKKTNLTKDLPKKTRIYDTSFLKKKSPIDLIGCRSKLTLQSVPNIDLQSRKKFAPDEEYIKRLQSSLEIATGSSVVFMSRSYKCLNNPLFSEPTSFSSTLRRFSPISTKQICTKTEANKVDELTARLIAVQTKLITQSDSTRNSIFIACQRYSEGLNKSDATYEERIYLIISALEALFLNDNLELGRKLQQRASYFAGKREPKTANYSRVIKTSYEIRSSYVHGSRKKKKTKEKPREIFFKLLAVLHMNLTVFMIMYSEQNHKKDDIIKMIDDALLDEKAHENFLKEYNKLKIQFPILKN